VLDSNPNTGGVQSPPLNCLEIVQRYKPRPYHTTSDPRSRFVMRCPIHDGDDLNFKISEDGQLWTCWSRCGGGNAFQLLQRLNGGQSHDFKPVTPAPAPKHQPTPKPQKPLDGVALADLVTTSKVDAQVATDLSWEDTTYGRDRTPAIRIPYYDTDGTLLFFRYRVQLSGDRFRQPKGTALKPYGLWMLEKARELGYIVLVEGETDTAALTGAGIPALGIPGAGNWKSEWAEYLEGIGSIYVWQEPGKAGQKFAKAINVPSVGVIKAPPGAKDPAELLHQTGDQFANFFERLLGEVRWKQELAEILGVKWDFDDPEITQKIEAPKPNVGNKVKGNKSPYTVNPTNPKKRRETLWDRASSLYPKLRAVKAIGASRIGIHTYSQKLYVWDCYSNTWRNPQNAQHKRRQLFMNLLPILNGHGPWWCLDISADDFSDAKTQDDFHEKMRLYVKRKRDDEGQYLGMDNLASRGIFTCIINTAPSSRWKSQNWYQLDNPEQWLIGGLKAIRPPKHGDEDGPKRFNPIKGTRKIQSAAEKAVDVYKDKIQLLAKAAAPTDAVLVEATGQLLGLTFEYHSDETLFRSQSSDYFMVAGYRHIEQVLDLLDGLEGYTLSKFALYLMAERGELVPA